MTRARLLFLTGLGTGYSPWAPGTMGTLVGFLLYILLWHHFSWPLYTLFTILLLYLGIRESNHGAQFFGEEDSPHIVIDEIVGYLVTMLGIKYGFWPVVLGFLLFRIWDIWKPFYPLEDFPGGWGVMLDDLAAGVLANIMLRIIF
ncbi:MAG: phosphatidylglycerophosphatase A [Aquificota bacterium]|nr:MAG: phosphatidylglycerophosphatase A [Aquificota bacterium]